MRLTAGATSPILQQSWSAILQSPKKRGTSLTRLIHSSVPAVSPTSWTSTKEFAKDAAAAFLSQVSPCLSTTMMSLVTPDWSNVFQRIPGGGVILM
jgi:hypothetical protein